MKEILTGRYRFRRTWPRGRMVLEVEMGIAVGCVYWRDATEADLKPGGIFEPMLADGWRFPEERDSELHPLNVFHACQKAGLEVRKTANTMFNLGITPYSALVRALHLKHRNTMASM